MFFAHRTFRCRYRIDREFIRRGLARNEDEYFGATGAELSLLWHPRTMQRRPRSSLRVFGRYRTISRDVDSLDWVTRVDARRSREPTSRHPSSWTRSWREETGLHHSDTTRRAFGRRDDYLYSRLDVLLDALIRSGYA